MSIATQLKRELSLYRSLHKSAKRLFFSSFLYEIASPLAFTFTNAFLFASGENNTLVALYNLGMFVSLPIGFSLNGYLLRKFPFRILIGSGVLLQGIIGMFLFFIPELSPLSIFSFGFFFGFPMALYWANRNYLTLAATTDEQCTYYAGIEKVMEIYVGVVIPFLIGLSILFITQKTHSAVMAYRLLAIIALIIHMVNSLVLLSLDVKNPTVHKVFLMKSSFQWLKVRTLEVFFGIENGLEMFIPSLIILTFLGGVETLGSLSSLSAAVGALIIYAMTSRIKPTQRASRFAWFVVAKIILAFLYLIFFSQFTALLLIILNPSLAQLKWPLQGAQVLKTLDDEEEGDSTNNYAYVSDQELFLNLGRVLGVAMFFGFSALIPQQLTLRIMPFALSSTQLGVAAIVFSLAKHSYRHLYQKS